MTRESIAEVAAIAAKLTKAQRTAVLALSSAFSPVPRATSRQAVSSLVAYRSGLVDREWQEGCAQCTYYRLTERGVALQSHLISQGADHDR